MITKEKINNIKSRIIELEQPLKIILFGSYARAMATDNSDLDLLIIKNTTLPKHKRAASLYRELAQFNIPMDLIVKTQQEFQKTLLNPRSFSSIINKEGILLYEK